MTYEAVKEFVKWTYVDCWMKDFQVASKLRNLDTKAQYAVSRQEAYDIVSEFITGYNAFTPKLILQLPEDSKITIAREGSVCLYVETEEPLTDLVENGFCDELDYDGKEYRLWWD